MRPWDHDELIISALESLKRFYSEIMSGVSFVDLHIICRSLQEMNELKKMLIFQLL